jgi:hypothetical protein
MMPMTRLLCLAVAGAGFATATPSQAQSRFDVCAAYARDSMMAFYSSSAVPVPRAARVGSGKRLRAPQLGSRLHAQPSDWVASFLF